VPGGYGGPSRLDNHASNEGVNSRRLEISRLVYGDSSPMTSEASSEEDVLWREREFPPVSLPELGRLAVPDLGWPADLFSAIA
jgi:hypothetical protein